MKRVTAVGFVGLWCLAAACSGLTRQEEGVGQVSSALVGKVVPIGDAAASRPNQAERVKNVAAGGGKYLVGWDKSDGKEATSVVTRLSSTGEILDPHGIPFPIANLGNGPSLLGFETEVAFDGQNFRVAAGGFYKYVARLTPQGEWLDTTDASMVVAKSIVCLDDGNCYGLKLDDPSLENRAWRFVHIDQNNQLADAPGTAPISKDVDSEGWWLYRESLIRVGQRVARVVAGMAPHDVEDIFVTKIWVEFFDPATGAVTAPLEIASTKLAETERVPLALAGRDGEALFVWRQDTANDYGSYDCTALARRIGSDGKALEAARSLPLTAEECGRIDSLFFTGSDYVLALLDEVHAPAFRRLSDVGELTSGTLSAGRADAVSFVGLASTGESMLLATSPSLATEYPADVRLFTTLLGQSGEASSAPQPIEIGTNHLREPAVAWGGESYFTVWVDDRNGAGRGDLFGARVSPDGTQLDATALPLVAAGGFRQTKPAIASSGQGYLVVDQAVENNGFMQAWATFVDSEGHAAAPTPLGSAHESAPAVAWNGRAYLAAWISDERGVQDLHAARCDEKGVPLEDSLIATIAFDYEGSGGPTIAATQDGFFVSWRQRAKSGSDQSDVYGVWLDDSSDELLAIGKPRSISGGTFVSESNAYQDTGAACSPNVCLVAWYDESGETKFRRFDGRGEALGPAGTLPTTVYRPLLAWDGQAFLISNADDRVVAGYMTEAGQPFTTTFPPASPETVSGVAIATDGAGHGLIVTADDKVGARLTGIFVSEDPPPEPNGGSGGQPADAGEPGTMTAGMSGVAFGGTPNENGGNTGTNGGASDGGAGETSDGGAGETSDGGAGESSDGGGGAGSGSSSAGASQDMPSAPAKTDQGCGCNVVGGDTSNSPWLLLGLLGVFARRRRR